MKKLIAVMAVLFSVNAAAFVGTGNEEIAKAREFMRFQNDAENIDYPKVSHWIGLVAGLSVVYGSSAYDFAICYPEKSTTFQLAEIAAQYLIDNPSKRAEATDSLVWRAHLDAFGFRASDDCWNKPTE